MQIASNKPAKSKGLSFAANVLIVLGLILILIPLYLTVITALVIERVAPPGPPSVSPKI